ncbi:MAG TPA: PAS domain S-box protein [Solirubrobacteraceae bacterium]|nr:PAS domain S-box protein [Solirubrobacteraceae bacterium]
MVSIHPLRLSCRDGAALLGKLRSTLPRGQTLPQDVWQRRHRALLVLLCLHAVALPVFGATQGYAPLHAVEHGAVLALLAAVVHAVRRRRRLAAVILSLGLITSSALLVHMSGGVIEAHFHFFVMIVVLALYEDWLPFLVAAGYVVVHHGLTGALDPHAVYNHADALAHPWKWALIHGAFVSAAGVASVVTWRLNESLRARADELYRRARASEQALAARERETRHILETAQDAFIAIDARGVISDWNQQAVATFGWSREEAVGRMLSHTIIPERYRAAYDRGLQRITATDDGRVAGRRMEAVAVDRADREFPVELTISPLQTSAGYVFYAFLHDISERKQADDLLERRRAQLAEAQSVARLGSWEWNVDTDSIEWSEELCRIYGVNPADHPARLEEFVATVHPQDRAAVAATVQASCASGEPFSFEHRIVRRDGSVRVLSARGEVILGADGRPLRVFGTGQDVTEQRDAEEAQRQMAAIVRSSEDAIIAWDLDGRIVSWNDGAQKIYGYSAADVVGRPVVILMAADRDERGRGLLDRTRRGEGVEQLASRHLRKDGRLIDVALTISPIRNGPGQVTGASMIARDISEQQLRERYLKVQHEATRVLAHAVSADEALPALLEAIGEGMGWAVGAVWMASGRRGTELRCKAFWHQADSAPAAFEAASRRMVLAPAAGLPGCVWRERVPRWVKDVTLEPDSMRAQAAAADGLHACILLPVVVGTEVLAIIEFLSHDVRSRDAALLELLDTLSAPIAQFLVRKRADEQLSHQAHHDALTGLPNRRRLMEDLELALTHADDEQRRALLILDLDGFKAYNDNFGHAAGDALLTRLGRRLAAEMRPHGTSYRMGGDEFCVIAAVPAEGIDVLVDRARAALSERGDAFSVTASCGSAMLPEQARTPSEALGLADRRMYAAKGSGTRASAARQSADVLLQVLAERNAQLSTHLDEVTQLCEAVGNVLAVPDEHMSYLLHAASLHDVGKAAIPEAILDKPGPLDDDEWAYIRRHTVMGERILAAAPALAPAARLVRASHERVDGKGYPDGLTGEDIPLGARIIAVCDAYDAMTENRPYRTAMSTEGALSELRACAGTQFDRKVVEALAAVVAAQRAAPVGTQAGR